MIYGQQQGQSKQNKNKEANLLKAHLKCKFVFDLYCLLWGYGQTGREEKERNGKGLELWRWLGTSGNNGHCSAIALPLHCFSPLFLSLWTLNNGQGKLIEVRANTKHKWKVVQVTGNGGRRMEIGRRDGGTTTAVYGVCMQMGSLSSHVFQYYVLMQNRSRLNDNDFLPCQCTIATLEAN